VKQERLGRLMALQQQISEEIQAAKVGTVMRVVIDRREGDYYIGRTEFSSPEVDPEVLIPAAERRLYKGHYYQALITDSDEFDLYGTVAGVKA
jgi:ribosomal protein S12 methylthiotransferase